MNVIIHNRGSQESKTSFKKIVANVHADLVESYINHLPLTKEQKLGLLKNVCDLCHTTSSTL